MATQYFYQLNGVDTGPISFRELVALVHEGTLREDDLVRSEWDTKWQPAASIVGLFHLAGRDDVLARWEAEQRRKAADQLNETATSFSTAELDDLFNAAGSLPEETLSTRPPKRGRTIDPVSEPIQFPDDAMRAAVRAELIKSTSRHERSAAFRPRFWEQWTFSSAFRLGVAALVANLTALLIIRWSRTEQLRFPDAYRAIEGNYLFPYWGACSPIEFGFLLLDVMLVTGLLGYGLARGLEMLTQD